MGFEFEKHADERHLKFNSDSDAGVFAGRAKAGTYSGYNGIIASRAGVGICGSTHIMATPESIRFSFLFVPNPAAIVPDVPAYIMAGPPVQGVAYMAVELGMFASLTAGMTAISATL